MDFELMSLVLYIRVFGKIGRRPCLLKRVMSSSGLPASLPYETRTMLHEGKGHITSIGGDREWANLIKSKQKDQGVLIWY